MDNQTIAEYKEVVKICKELFAAKTHDYGTAWRILRLPSLTDQILIKAYRIRTIWEKKTQKISDDIYSEFVGIVNYGVIALMQLQLSDEKAIQMTFEQLEPLYDKKIEETLLLLTQKNHDYGEVWRDMRISSIVDIILMKLFRVKQIEDHTGKTFVSEGVKSNYQDMINYAVLALIKCKKE